ncbi:P-loop containing nucleoside triphosphate hydrolase protein [Hypomontagnella monticulosa]|nr:P-loop containing nucleoside triphosphate hydrolase protein [Hypomontagnella monticulosa]
MLPIISLLGMPASGKTTLGLRLARQFNLYYLSLDDSPTREEIFQNDTTLQWVQSNIKSVSEAGNHKAILLDGFPVRPEEAHAIQQAFRVWFPEIVILILCLEKDARSRFFQRAAHDPSVIPAMDRRFAHYKRNMELLFEEAFGHTGFVLTANDGGMTIDEAYNALLSMLDPVDAWKDIVSTDAS